VLKGCDAFHYSAYSGFEGILLEANAKGSTFISGWAEDCLPKGKFYGEPSRNENLQFHLLKRYPFHTCRDRPWGTP
jgi:hypothetical protein